MKTVYPIKDVEIIQEIKEYLLKKNRRDYMIFILGTHMDLNLSELLQLKVKDVKGKDFIQLRKREVIIPESIKTRIMNYCRNKDHSEYLFHSQKSDSQPLHRNSVYMIMKDIEARFGLERLGCQSLRKTYWHHLSILISKEYMK